MKRHQTGNRIRTEMSGEAERYDTQAMLPNSRSLLPRAVVLLAIIAGLTALLVQPGEMGSIDTDRRLQNTHSFWTNEPPVLPEDYPDFGVIGRNGTVHGWYGIG